MTREEVGKLMAMINAAYPNMKAENKTATVDAWFFLLNDHDANEIMLAFKTFVNTSNSGFAPSISELIALTHKVEDLSEESGAEAWSLVRKAIARSTYNSKEEFEKLPVAIQQAVGSPEVLHSWATNEFFAEGTVMKSFLLNYQNALKRQRDINMLPAESRLRLEQIRQEKAIEADNHTLLIGQPLDALQEGQFDYKAAENATLGEYSRKLREELGDVN